MAGHEGEVCTLALLEEKQQVISGSGDGTLRVWRLPSGQPEMVLRGHLGRVLDIAVSPDGRRAVSASADSTLRVWDLTTGKTQHVLTGHTGAVLAVAITQDGERVVSASADNTLRVWNPETGRTRVPLVGHSAEVRALALVPGGRRAISASADGTLRLWHIAGALHNILVGHREAVTGVAVMGQGWGGRLVYLSPGSLLRVNGAKLSREGWAAISAFADGTLRLWDLETGGNAVVFEGAGAFTCCASSPNGQAFVAGDEQGQVHFIRQEGDRASAPAPMDLPTNL
jgi:WD40 repeat protein